MQPLTRVLPVSCAIAAFAVCLAAKDFIKPAAHPAKTYPAHDDHSDEKVAIAADPYDTPDKAKTFSISFREHGFLPIFFFVTNVGDIPLAGSHIDITGVNDAKGTELMYFEIAIGK